MNAIMINIDIYNNTPLIWASANGHLSIVNTLLVHGGDMNATTKENKKAIHYATINKRDEVVKALESFRR